jgi:hypothetical protein
VSDADGVGAEEHRLLPREVAVGAVQRLDAESLHDGLAATTRLHAMLQYCSTYIGSCLSEIPEKPPPQV